MRWGLHKNPWTPGFKDPLGWWTHPNARKVAHPNPTGTKAPIFRTFLDFSLYLFHLAVPLYPLLYKKLINIRMCFPEFCEPFLQLSYLRREYWEPRFITDSLEIQETTKDLKLASEVGEALWGWALNLCDLTLLPGR